MPDTTKPQNIEIWIDGSAVPNPGAGGWCAMLVCEGQVRVLVGHQTKATNNEMESRALLEALRKLRYPCLITVYTDSQYVQYGVRAVSRDKPYSSNRHVWDEIAVECSKHLAVRIIKVISHTRETEPLNRLCDKYARMAAQRKIGTKDDKASLSKIIKGKSYRAEKIREEGFATIS
jgi:ribonuclease HI